MFHVETGKVEKKRPFRSHRRDAPLTPPCRHGSPHRCPSMDAPLFGLSILGNSKFQGVLKDDLCSIHGSAVSCSLLLQTPRSQWPSLFTTT